MKRFVIKVESLDLELNENILWDNLSCIVEDISNLQASGNELLIITSDAFTVGKRQNCLQGNFNITDHRYGIWRDRDSLREKICSVIGQPLLISHYVELFKKHNRLVAQILLTRSDLADQTRYESIRVMTLNLLTLGIIPIFCENDALSAGKLGFGDSDQLACMLAMAFQVDKLIFLTNIEGIFVKEQAGNEKLIQEINNLDDIKDIISYPEDQVGKAQTISRIEAARLVTSFGIEMNLMNRAKMGILTDSFLNGITHGTKFLAHGTRLKQRKSWVALAALSKGDIVVSTFLAEAIKTLKPASILLIGVEEVIGSFGKNDVVTVKDVEGRVLGRGEIRYSSKDLIKLVQKRINGEKMEFFGSEIIHCDYFVRAPGIGSPSVNNM